MPVSRFAQLALAAMLLAVPASASASARSEGATPYAKPPPSVSRQQARDIAWRLGIIQIEEMALDGIRWEIAGRDESGNERLLDINAYDGSVLR